MSFSEHSPGVFRCSPLLPVNSFRLHMLHSHDAYLMEHRCPRAHFLIGDLGFSSESDGVLHLHKTLVGIGVPIWPYHCPLVDTGGIVSLSCQAVLGVVQPRPYTAQPCATMPEDPFCTGLVFMQGSCSAQTLGWERAMTCLLIRLL